MIVCIAKNYQTFKNWRDDHVVYVGDRWALAKIDPANVKEIRFIGDDFRDQPLYFTDEFLEFQFNVALAKRGDGLTAHVNAHVPAKSSLWDKLRGRNK